MAEEGALVLGSVDGDYIPTPLTKAGWGRRNYHVLVGDTEAPMNGGYDQWQLMEGTSVTAAAAVRLCSSPFDATLNESQEVLLETVLISCVLTWLSR
jgi:hypothetical protein